jgi:peroxiredoxin
MVSESITGTYFMVSVDTLADNKAFAAKERADFPMLANPDKKVALAYGVIPADAPPDRQFARRWTFSSADAIARCVPVADEESGCWTWRNC